MLKQEKGFKSAEDYGLELPQLVLATRQIELKMTQSRKWLRMSHKTPGYKSNEHYFLATSLAVKDEEVLSGMRQLTDNWLDSLVMEPALEQAIKYSQDLKTYLGESVGCNYSYRHLQEGIYPLDCENYNLRTLTDEELPNDLDDLVDWRDEPELRQAVSDDTRWELLILGNCGS